MASRLVKGAVGVARVRPTVPIRTVPPIITALNCQRFNSTGVPQQGIQLPQQGIQQGGDSKQVEPAAKAQSIIDALPGSNLISKTAILSGGASLAIWLIANEIYVVNEETITAIATLSSFCGIYYFAKPYYIDWAQSHIDRQKAVLNEAKQNHKNVVQERLDSLQELSGVIDITRGLFEVSRETARLEAEAYELQQKTSVVAEAKQVLDSWVRYESQLKQRQQQELAQNVISKINKELENPKNLQQILNQSVTDVEKILSSKAQ